MYKVKTRLFMTDPLNPGPELDEPARLLRDGGLVAFPTETVYGLGAAARDARAIHRMYEAKGRPADNPTIVHVSSPGDVEPLVQQVKPVHARLIERFWPGPLTLIFNRSSRVPPVVSSGLDTVAVRMPRHRVALELIARASVPVAAPSANLSGRPSPTTARHVLDDLDGRIDAVVDGGPAGVGVESTVLDLTGQVPVILRPGGVTREALQEFLGEVEVAPGILEGGAGYWGVPASPGMKYRHYAPRAELWLVEGPREAQVARIKKILRDLHAKGLKVGVLAHRETAHSYDAFQVVTMGSWDRPDEVASQLFAALRQIDASCPDMIVAEGMVTSGMGLAVMNRLRKAATRRCNAGASRVVLLVCTGNTCRSSMAQVILERILQERGLAGYTLVSAGVSAFDGTPATAGAVSAVAEMGLDLSGHRARRLQWDMVDWADLIITMTAEQRDRVLQQFPEARGKTHVLREYVGLSGDVQDPWSSDAETYRRTAQEIRSALERLVDILAGETGPGG
ncbi:MAG: L-threonylcarbamoyladenylate synthase [Bacillota bacterium]